MASFRTLVNKQVLKAFNKTLGDISEQATLTPITASYNTATAIDTPTEGTAITFKAVFVGDAKRLALLARLAARGSVDTIEGNADALAVLVPAAALGGYVPKRKDKITRGADAYTVESVTVDPVAALYKLSLRLP